MKSCNKFSAFHINKQNCGMRASYMFKKMLIPLLLFPILAFSDCSKGEKLVKQLWKDIKAGNVNSIKKYTSSQYQGVYSIRARNRSQLLEFIPHVQLHSYTLSKFKSEETHDTIIVTYYVKLNATVDGQTMKTKYPRLAVYAKIKGNWKLIATADVV
jgi:hypothetical protein